MLKTSQGKYSTPKIREALQNPSYRSTNTALHEATRTTLKLQIAGRHRDQYFSNKS